MTLSFSGPSLLLLSACKVRSTSPHRACPPETLQLIPPPPLTTRVFGPTLRLIQPLVQYPTPPVDERGRKDRQRAAHDDQTTRHTVHGLLAGREEVWAEPVARLAYAVRDSDQGSLLGTWRRNQGRLPGQLQIQAAISANDEQNHTKVAGSDV